MQAPNGSATSSPDHESAGLYWAGGISAILLGLGYLIIMAAYLPMGPPPAGAEPKLAYLAKNENSWWIILGLSVLTDLLFVPIALSLYQALRAFNRNVMLMATACVALFVFLDLALTWPNYGALVTIGGIYGKAATDVQRATIVAVANYPSAILESGLLFVYNTLTLAMGILLTGLVMLNGVFGKWTAYLGVFTGVLGIASVVGSFFGALSAGVVVTSLLTTAWVIVIGYRLCALGRARASQSGQ